MSAMLDNDLSFVRTAQLDALERMQTDASMYYWRIVEEVSFLAPRGQQWTRRIELRLPSLPNNVAHDRVEHSGYFIVPLGTFRRVRFPDFEVSAEGGNACHLLTRRQHGYALAACLTRQLFAEHWVEEIDPEFDPDRQALGELHSYLASMITTMAGSGFTEDGAVAALDRLLASSGIEDEEAMTGAREVLRKHCRSSLFDQTQYLCWVQAGYGEIVHLTATYTQADTARFVPEVDGSRSEPRILWRNWRTMQYGKYNVLPLHYSFDAPEYRDCKSYYFTVTAPADSRITLLDWVNGRHFHGPAEDRPLWNWLRRRLPRMMRRSAFERDAPDESESPGDGMLPDGAAQELDCAKFAYHFYNRRNISDRRHREGETPKERRRSVERRAGARMLRARLHVFVRAERTDDSQLLAIGVLSLILAVLAEFGSLFTASTVPGRGGSVGQWLLLAPAALTLFTAQQRRHRYAGLTRRYRLWLWLYTALATVFAASVAFESPRGVADWWPAFISGAFAVASGVLIATTAWSGRLFERGARRRCEKIIQRVDELGTPSAIEAGIQQRRGVAGGNVNPADLRERRNAHPSYMSYIATARHGIDRAFGAIAVLAVSCGVVMIFFVPWGTSEECEANRDGQQRRAIEHGQLPPTLGECNGDRWIAQPMQSADIAARAKAGATSAVAARPVTLAARSTLRRASSPLARRR
jgi:uncharacterized membrane protein